MKKRKRFVVCIAVIAVIVLSIITYFFFPIKPFSRLSSDDVQKIFVFTAPPEIQVELTSDEIGEAVNLLKDFVVYQPNYQPNFTSGQVVRFTIIYTDSTSVEVAISGNVSLTLSGKSYRANYEAAEALTALANQVVK